MAKKQSNPTELTTSPTIDLGPFTLDSALIACLPTAGYAKTGVIVANDRIKFRLTVNDIPTEFTASVYIQRNAINDDESKAVATTKEERETAKAARDNAEQTKNEREKKAAFELGQSATMSALRNIGELAAGAQALTRLVK